MKRILLALILIAVSILPVFAIPSSPVLADGGYLNSGGTITTDGLYTIHTFNLSQSGNNFVCGKSGNITILVVAGGGGGGAGRSGGGGAGGLIYNASFSVTVQNYSVTVGDGGAGGAGNPLNGNPGTVGEDSVFSTLTAKGGGAGGKYDANGGNGGSGGGAGPTFTGGTATAGQGNAGGNGGLASGTYPSGGGGGAGATGQAGGASAAGDGGDGGVGLAYDIVEAGTDIYYAGGGGGGIYGLGAVGEAGIGGNGGGGDGTEDATAAEDGTDDTGGGGGGSGVGGPPGWVNSDGGDGGSGIVIIRCLTGDFSDCSVNLTTASSAGGDVTTPGEGVNAYSCNESVNIEATADACYHFVNWTGDTATIANASAASTTINMSTTNKSITANFAINQYTLTYTAGAGGTITGTTPQTVNCGSNGSQVTAIPNACYYFVNWSDAVATASRTDLNISADLNVTANFASYTYEPPTTLTCNPSATSIELNWILGANTSAAYIRYKVGSYPITLFDGNLIGTITGDNYTHTGLISGNSYFYKVWGVNGNCISTNSTTVLCTTYYSAGAGATPGAPTAPDNWTGQLDDTELVDLPVYEFGNLVADEGGIPYATFWGIGIMGAMIVIALICYNKTHNVFLTCLSITIGLLALGALGVIPFFVVGLFVIMSLIVTVREGREI